MTITARRMTSFAVDATPAAGGGVAAACGPPAPAARHPADLSFTRRTFYPVTAPLLCDDGTALRTL